MKLNVKPMPAVMMVLSALYFFYVLTSEDTVLSADAVGGDPGGKVLPMAMAVFMFIGFLYLTVKERPEKTEVNSETRRLFLLTLILSVAYIFLIRWALSSRPRCWCSGWSIFTRPSARKGAESSWLEAWQERWGLPLPFMW